MGLVTGFWSFKTFAAAVELDLFTRLAGGRAVTVQTASTEFGLCPVELVEDRQREALLVECRARKIEPPGRTRIEKVLVAARGKWERTFCARTISRLGKAGVARLLGLVAEGNDAGTALLAALKRDPGAVGLDPC
jgi:hypothetical protein